MGNSLSFPSFGRNNVYPDNDSIEESVQSIGQAATSAARKEAREWQRKFEEFKESAKVEKENLERINNEKVAENKRLKLEIESLKNVQDENMRLRDNLKDKDEKINELEKEVENMKSEERQIKNEKKNLMRLRSASYDSRKVNGDVLPGDITHSDVQTNYIQFFKTFNRSREQSSDTPITNPTRLTVTCFQSAFELSSRNILNNMTEELNELFENPSEENVEELLQDQKTLERRNDICRAFAILLYHCKSSKSNDFQTKVYEKLKVEFEDKTHDDNMLLEAAKIAQEMVTLIPPMICSQPIKYNEDHHDIKQCAWTIEDGPYELVYIRPVLFYGRNGSVAAKGQVGNISTDDENAVNIATKEPTPN